MRKHVFALAIAVAFAGLSQAATVAAPVHRAVPDLQIEHRIQAKFAKSKIHADHFTVSVKGGVATIDGKTSVIQHKGVATRLAKTGGALVVKNHIQISDEAKAKAAANLAKSRGAQPELAHATVIPQTAKK